MPNKFSPFKQFCKDLKQDKDYIALQKRTIILPFLKLADECRDKHQRARQARLTAQVRNECLITPEILRLLYPKTTPALEPGHMP